MKTSAKNPSKFSGIMPTARLKPESHSSFTQARSDHYHSKIIEKTASPGTSHPNNQGGLGPDEVNRTGSVKTNRKQMKMQSPRPGLTAQRGLGG